MATNPRIPPEREPHRPYQPPEVAKLQKQGRFPWPLVALIVAAAILALIAYYVPRVPKTNPAAKAQGELPSQPAPDMIGVSNVKMTLGPTNSNAYLDAVLANHGEKAVTAASVQLIYATTDGKSVRGDEEPVLPLKDPTGADTTTLADHPLPAGGTLAVRVPVLSPPANWDHRAPGVEIVSIAVK